MIRALLWFVAGYLVATYSVFESGLSAVPPEYRPGVIIFAALIMLALLIDKVYAQPAAKRKARS